MSYIIAKGKWNTYYKYGSYYNLETAIRTAKYFKRKNHKTRWKITEEFINNRKIFNLWLTNNIRW